MTERRAPLGGERRDRSEPPRFSAVLVNFRTADHVAACLAAVASAAGELPGEVVLVDSASPDRARACAAAASSPLPVEVLALESNRGFGAAANAGAARARAPLILFINPDARPGRGDLERLVAALEARPEAGAVGPRLVDARGRHQTGDAGEVPTAARAWAYAAGATRRGLFASPGREPAVVGWLSGACLLVRAAAFRAVGGFDERFFLFGEDVDLGVRLGRAGFPSFHDVSVEVAHEGGASYRRGRRPPLEGRWARGLVQAHAATGAGRLERASFALALALGLAGRAAVYALGGSLERSLSPAERRARGRRLWAAAGEALLSSARTWARSAVKEPVDAGRPQRREPG